MATYLVGSTRPYTTIQAAVNAAAADLNPSIVVDPGTYNEVLDLKKASGGRVVPVFIYAADPLNPPVISGTGMSAGQAVLANSVIATGATERPRFVNLVFENWNLANVSYVFYTASTGPSIRAYSCTFRNSDAPVLQNLRGPNGPDRTVIYGCRFIDTGQPIHAENGTYGLVARCYFKPNPNTLCVYNDRTNWELYNNSAYVNNNGSYGVFRGSIAKNNIVQTYGGNTPQSAFNCTGGSYDYNHVYGTTGANTGTDGGHNTSGSDPLFVSPSTGNLDIQVGSPCIDAGTTITDAAVDIYNVTAPSGAAYDKGAHELVANTTVSSITVLGSTSIRLNLAASKASDSSWATAANFTITPSGGAAAVTVSAAAASGDPGTYIDLTTTEHTNGGTYSVAWAGLTNVTSGSTGYAGQGTAPTLSSASYTGPDTVRVVFAEGMTNNAALTTAANYTLTPAGGAGFSPIVVTRVNSTTVDLACTHGLDAATGSLSVTGPQDLALNAAAGATAALSAWQTTITDASAVWDEGIGLTTVSVTLAGPVYGHSGWWDANSWSISGPTTAIPADITADGDPATTIFFNVEEMQTGEAYTVSWQNLVGVQDGSVALTGAGAVPSASVSMLEPATLRVTYTRPMQANADLTDAANYSISSGITAAFSPTAVVGVDTTTVDLTVDRQVIGDSGYLTVTGPVDTAGNACSVVDVPFDVNLVLVSSVAARAVEEGFYVRLELATPTFLDPSWETAGALSISGSPALTAEYAAVGGTPTAYIDFVTNEPLDDAPYTATWAGLAGVLDGDAEFTGVAAPPAFEAASTGASAILLQFSEAMSASGLSTSGNYTVTPDVADDYPVTVTAATPNVGRTQVALTITGGVAGADYVIEASSAIRDPAGNQLEPATAALTFGRTTLASASAAATDTVEVALGMPAVTTSLSEVGRWSITRRAPVWGSAVTVTSVTVDAPDAVTLTTSGHSNGQAYRVSFSGSDGVEESYADYEGAGPEVRATVRGAYFSSSTAVAVLPAGESTWVPATHVTVVSAEEIDAVLPTLPAGSVVQLRVTVGSRSAQREYTYPGA